MTISEHDHDHRSDANGTRPTGRFVRTDAPQRGATGGRDFPRNGLGEATDPVLHETPDRDTAADGAPHGTATDGAPHGTAADPKSTAGAAPAAPAGPTARSSSTAPAAPTAPAAARPAAATAPGGAGQERRGPGAPVLLPPDLAAQSARRLDRAMAGFVDDPGRAVREADEALEEAVRQLVENLEGRRTTLRDAWQGSTADGSSRTEDLRLALRDYRDLLQHLLAV